MYQHHQEEEQRCPYHVGQVTGSYQRLVESSVYDKGMSPALKRLNTPEPQRARELAERIVSIAAGWAGQDTLKPADPDYQHVSQGWYSFCKFLKAISATDFSIGWSDDRILVERSGQRFQGKRKEISALTEVIIASEDEFSWAAVNPENRFNLALFMLLSLRGAPLEEANRLCSVHDVSLVLAESLARIESIGGEVFFSGSDPQFVDGLICFPHIERCVLEKNGLTKVVLVEGTRMPLYIPTGHAQPDPCAFFRLASKFDQKHVDTDVYGLVGNILEQTSVDEFMFKVLQDIWEHFADEAMIIQRPHDGNYAEGDTVVSWCLVAGRMFTYSGVIERRGEALEVISYDSPHYCGQYGRITDRSWRRSCDTVGNYPLEVTDKVKQFRTLVMEAESMDEETLQQSTDHYRAVHDASKLVTRRLINHNLAAGMKGTQLGTTTLQPGWSLSYDQGDQSEGYGKLNNPAHALGGVQTMFRAPIGGTLFSQVRLWRERGDIEAQYSLNDIPIFNAYHMWLDAALRHIHNRG